MKLFFYSLSVGVLRHFISNDLPIFIVLVSATLLVIVFQVFHKGMGLIDYLTGPMEETGNLYSSWILGSIAFAMCWSVILSSFIPAVPRSWQDLVSFSGFRFTSFGFVFWCVSGLMLFRSIFSFLFFHTSGHKSTWLPFVHQALQFHTVYTLFLLPSILIWFYILDSSVHFFPHIIAILGGIEVLKIVHYLIHHRHCLPHGWYHKMLYICTLEILPLFFLWKYIYM